MIKRPTMEAVWLHTAIELATRSECSKAKVGCLITTSDFRKILANGYNGYAKGITYKCDIVNCQCLHAESNALLDCGSFQKDKIMFITMFPCLNCAIQIVNSGFSKIFYYIDYKKESHHWNDYKTIMDLFKKSKIIVKKYEF